MANHLCESDYGRHIYLYEFVLSLVNRCTYHILDVNKEKLPFLNKEEPLDKSSAPITENDNDVETNNNEPENIDKNEPIPSRSHRGKIPNA